MSKWTLEEQKLHRREWVKALRSGTYKQGLGYLRNKDNEYCCLGVACVIAGHSPNEPSFIEDLPETIYPPKEVMDYFGLVSEFGAYEEKNSLVSDNDDSKFNFAKIADIIESEPNGLFIVE